jgi:glycosyltransferase involved in cell wall biosynthesis
MTTPLISVFINTYNHQDYIEQAIVSVLEQDFPSAQTEIVVVDDGSTDNTPSVVQKFGSRLRYIRKDNGGQVSTLNAALPDLRGKIVAFLDGDDWWAKQKLAATVEAFEANPEIAAVGHGYYDVQDRTPTAVIAPEKTSFLDLSSVNAARLADSGATLLVTSRLSVRRRILAEIGPLPPEAVFFDALVFTLSFALGGALVLEEPLCYYRHHANNLHNPTAVNPATQLRIIAALGFRLEYLPSRLAQFGVSPDVIKSLMAPKQVEYERMQLRFGEKPKRWNVFRTESRRFRTSYKNPSIGYQLFRFAVCACAIALPPRRFYRLLDWYDRNDLKRLRSILGKSEPVVAPTFIRRCPIA